VDSPSFVIALDVGGTSVKSGLVRPDDMRVLDRARTSIDSHAPAEAILSAFARCIQERGASAPGGAVAGVALAFPGPFEYDTGVCRIAGVQKLEALYGLSIGSELSRRTGFPASGFVFINDAEAAIGGEIGYGAASGHARVIGVTLGTGIGSGFFVDGRRQTAGPGVPANGGWLFDQPFEGAMADDCFSIRGLERRLARAGAGSRQPEAAAADARRGEPCAQAAFEAFGHDLGGFLGGFAQAFAADAILVAGGLGGAFDLFGNALQGRLEVPVLRGALGADAPLLGAAGFFCEKGGRE
jgi:glucokinase